MPADAWSDIAGHRDRLLRIARRRCPTREDAEDIVSEAMLRCATFDGLDEKRVEQFLTAVVVRLCADHYRKAERRGRALVKLAGDSDITPGPEDELFGGIDPAELDRLLAALPERQRSVLHDRADGLSVTQIASRHALTYKATESALARARGTMRAALAAAFGAVAAFVRWIRPKRAVAAIALPAVTLLAVSAVLHLPLLDEPDVEARAPHDVPFPLDDLPRRFQPVLRVEAPAQKPVAVATRTVAPAVPQAKTTRRQSGERDVIDLSKHTPAKGKVTTNPDAIPPPLELAQMCVENKPWVAVDPQPDGEVAVYEGCQEERPDKGRILT